MDISSNKLTKSHTGMYGHAHEKETLRDKLII